MAPKAKQKEVQRSEEEQAAFDEHEQILQKALDAGVRLFEAWKRDSNSRQGKQSITLPATDQHCTVLPLTVASPRQR
jgi:hypothetical protein